LGTKESKDSFEVAASFEAAAALEPAELSEALLEVAER